MKLWSKIGIALVLIAAIGSMVLAYVHSASSVQTAGIVVNVVKATPGTLRQSIFAPARIEATEDVEIRAGIASPSIALLVKNGDTVPAGQLLARLDTTDLNQQLVQQQSALSQAQSQLAQLQRQLHEGTLQANRQVEKAKVDLDNARANLVAVRQDLTQQAVTLRQSLSQNDEAQAAWQQQATTAPQDDAEQQAQRLRSLLLQKSALTQQLASVTADDNPRLVQAKLGVQTAQADVDAALHAQAVPGVLPEQMAAAEQAVRSARETLDYVTGQVARGEIRAPHAGTVISVEATEGQMVQVGTLIFDLGVLNPSKVTLRVEEADVGKVKSGLPLTVTTVAFPDDTFTGAITGVDQRALANSGTGPTFFQARGQINNPDLKLRVGMNCDAEILVDERKNVLTVGLEALDEMDGASYLWVIKDHMLRRVPVRVGLRNKARAEIVSGLNNSDLVVVGPLATMKLLRDGMSPMVNVLADDGVAK